MKDQKFWLTLIFSFFSFFSFSQNDNLGRNEQIPLNLKYSFNSSLIYPGARLGVEYQIKTIEVTKIKKSGKKKYFDRERFISANLSWYHHPNFQDNFYLTAGWAMRRTQLNGFFTEFSPEIGLSRTFLGGTTYKVDNNGNVSIVKLAGYYYALVSLGGGVGYDFSKIKHRPFMLFYKFNLLSMYPYNSTIYLRPAMEIGMIYKLSYFHLLKSKSKE
jgi:hypothetical protein